MKRFVGFALFFALACLLNGCATSDPDRQSDIPWNAPQAWEGAPSIPGLDAR